MARKLTLVLGAALLAATSLPAAAAQDAAGADSTAWQVDLTTVNGDDVNVTTMNDTLTAAGAGDGEAYLVLPERHLSTAVNRVNAEKSAAVPRGAEVEIAVRGVREDGSWSQWTPTSDGAATLPQATRTVQVRVGMFPGEGGAWPTVRDVALDASRVASAERAGTRQLAYRVYATREGLVGGTTANGHVITERDHFVALPSGRSLSPLDTDDYSVQVCTTDGALCEYAPVWDVGPWNTKDDYWSPPEERESWQDLPQGTPEAQAAYDDGYNGGLDEFGRAVGNPAGIDLADGTFWDGLGMTDNGYVDVTYQWTASGASAEVSTEGTDSDVVTVRGGAGEGAAVTGSAANHAGVKLQCSARGDEVDGTVRSSDVWYRIGEGHYVSAANLKLDSARSAAQVPAC